MRTKHLTSEDRREWDVPSTWSTTTEVDLLDDLIRLLEDGLVVVEQLDEDADPRFQLTRKGVVVREFLHRVDPDGSL